MGVIDRDYNGDELEAFKCNVEFYRNLTCDVIFHKVMKTVQKAIDTDEMDFSEALDYATKKRKFLILRTIDEARNEEEEKKIDSTLGRGLYLSQRNGR